MIYNCDENEKNIDINRFRLIQNATCNRKVLAVQNELAL